MLAAALAAPATHAEKVLRYALRSAKPVLTRPGSPTSTPKTITAAMIEGLLQYDFSVRSYRLRPHTAAALPR